MYKINTAVSGYTFLLITTQYGISHLVTSGTVIGRVSLDGAAPDIIADTPIHVGSGIWAVDLTATEMNGTTVTLTFTHTITEHTDSFRTTVKLVEEAFTLGPVNAATWPTNVTSTPIPFSTFQGEDKDFVLTLLDVNGDPIDATSMDLRCVIETAVETPEEVFKADSVEVSDTNIVTIGVLAAQTTSVTPDLYQWRLWDDNTPAVVSYGRFTIMPAS